MKKRILTTTAVLAAALMVVSSVAVSAGSNKIIDKKNNYVDLHEQYLKYPKTFMTVFYDYGTPFPYDDARATTEMEIKPDWSVTSKVYLECGKGHHMGLSKNAKNYKGIVHSGEAYLGGIDYATHVKHEGYQKLIGTKTADGYIYHYYQK